MTEKEIYLDLAQRFIAAATSNINTSKIHEAASFECYHAFESIAGAFNCYIGALVPGKHAKKLNAFVNNYRYRKMTRIQPTTIAGLAIKLSSMRNRYLYPIPDGPGYTCPKDQLTIAQTRRQIGQINAIVANFVLALT